MKVYWVKTKVGFKMRWELEIGKIKNWLEKKILDLGLKTYTIYCLSKFIQLTQSSQATLVYY